MSGRGQEASPSAAISSSVSSPQRAVSSSAARPASVISTVPPASRAIRSALIQEYCFLNLKAPVQRVAGFDTVMPYYKLELEYLPDAKRVQESIQQVLAY